MIEQRVKQALEAARKEDAETLRTTIDEAVGNYSREAWKHPDGRAVTLINEVESAIAAYRINKRAIEAALRE